MGNYRSKKFLDHRTSATLELDQAWSSSNVALVLAESAFYSIIMIFMGIIHLGRIFVGNYRSKKFLDHRTSATLELDQAFFQITNGWSRGYPSKLADKELHHSLTVTSSLSDHILAQDNEYGYNIV